MKKLFDLVYCDSVLTAAVVWYTVKVGKSQRDRNAHASLVKLANASTSFLYVEHSLQMADFQEKVAESLFPCPREKDGVPVAKMRRAMVEVTTVQKFLRKCPPALLNAEILPMGKTACLIR